MKNDFSFLLYACRENLLILSQPKDCYQILLEISLFLVALIFQRKVRSVCDLEWRKRLSRGLSSDVAVCGGRKKLTSAGEKNASFLTDDDDEMVLAVYFSMNNSLANFSWPNWKARELQKRNLPFKSFWMMMSLCSDEYGSPITINR